MSEGDKYGIVSFDVPENKEEQRSLMALGVRLAILQGVYDVTYIEITECLEESFSHRKVNVE
jgi:hypothetical protein